MNFVRIGYDKSFNEKEMMCNFNRCTREVFTRIPKGVISKTAAAVKMQINADIKTKKYRINVVFFYRHSSTFISACQYYQTMNY